MLLGLRRARALALAAVVVVLGCDGVARGAEGLSARGEQVYRRRALVPNPTFSFGAPFFRDGVPLRPSVFGDNAAVFCGEFERCRAELRVYRRWRMAELTTNWAGTGMLIGGLVLGALRDHAASEGRREDGLRWTAVGLLTGATLSITFSWLVAGMAARGRLLDAMRWHNVDLYTSLRGVR